uniref:mitogen-activated protein kinase n=1 Tax=Oryza glaberrima TaxID=4538 RepID=I1PY77_ORYGL
MGGRARSILRWLRHHRSRRVSSSSFHLTTTGDDTVKDLHDPRREDAEGDGWEEVHEGPESDPEEYIALVSEDAGTHLPDKVCHCAWKNQIAKFIDPFQEPDFFTEYGEANRYKVSEVIGKGSYGVVAAAVDTQTGERVAIKKINDVFDHVSDATRILREIKLLRLLRHPDIVEIKHIMLPPSRREFRDIYVIFELMESDLHQVIKANDDLTPEHHQFFLYQLLRGMKYIHAASVFHRDLKPKNILANADCKLKVCDFGLARVSFNDAPSAIFWTDYVATRWYRAPELCGSFFSKYTPAIDIWSVGCIFAELLTGKPLFPGKNVVHQLDLMTDLLGTPSAESLAKIRNEKARRYLSNMRKKPRVPFTKKFPGVDPMALHLLERLLAFDPKDRPSAEEALTDPYFNGLANSEREPIAQPISKLEFEFEKRKLAKDDVRELIYREILEYHPHMLQEYLRGGDQMSFMYPRKVMRCQKRKPGGGRGELIATSWPWRSIKMLIPRVQNSDAHLRSNQKEDLERAIGNKHGDDEYHAKLNVGEKPCHASVTDGISKPLMSARSLLKSESISASKCIGEKPKQDRDQEDSLTESMDETADEVSEKVAQLKT